MTSPKKPSVAFWATVVVVLALGVWRESLDRHEYLDVMSVLIGICGVAFTAICIWLGVRIVNRRERWAKWTLGFAVGLPVLYVLSFGPACWIATRTRTEDAKFFAVVYWPMWWALHRDVGVVDDFLAIYATIGMRSGDSPQIPSVGRPPHEDWDESTTIAPM